MNTRNEHRRKALFSRRHMTGLSRLALIGALALSPIVSADANASGKRTAATRAVDGRQIGKASWYGPGFHGKRTASGERFDPNQLTAAHPRLPLGTRAKVTNLNNGKAVEVTINDRGPYRRGRIIDLSRAAAQQLAMGGTARVSIEALR